MGALSRAGAYSAGVFPGLTPLSLAGRWDARARAARCPACALGTALQEMLSARSHCPQGRAHGSITVLPQLPGNGLSLAGAPPSAPLTGPPGRVRCPEPPWPIPGCATGPRLRAGWPAPPGLGPSCSHEAGPCPHPQGTALSPQGFRPVAASPLLREGSSSHPASLVQPKYPWGPLT